MRPRYSHLKRPRYRILRYRVTSLSEVRLVTIKYDSNVCWQAAWRRLLLWYPTKELIPERWGRGLATCRKKCFWTMPLPTAMVWFRISCLLQSSTLLANAHFSFVYCWCEFKTWKKVCSQSLYTFFQNGQQRFLLYPRNSEWLSHDEPQYLSHFFSCRRHNGASIAIHLAGSPRQCQKQYVRINSTHFSSLDISCITKNVSITAFLNCSRRNKKRPSWMKIAQRSIYTWSTV